jgi:hypothetical protein
MKKLATYFSIFIILFATIVGAGCTSTGSKTLTANLASLDRSMGLSGSFVLGSGYIEGYPAYTYYVKLDNGGYQLKTVMASVCTVFQDQDETPYITAEYRTAQWYEERTSTSDYGEIGSKYIVRDGHTYVLNSIVEIHIPANSIVREFKP